MKLPETATIEQVHALLGELDAALAAAKGSSLVIDASALKDFDTSAVAVLLEARRRAKRAGVAVDIQGMPPKLLELAQLYGVDELLSLTPA
jgi:phospholipid transport system transporter-binding protein